MGATAVDGSAGRRVDWRPLYDIAGRSTAARGADRRPLARAHRLIEGAYDLDLDLGRIAAEAGYSPAHFLRRYAEVYGDTPIRSLNRRRMVAARDLLERTDLSVTEVCVRVGFASLGSFSSRFRLEFGRPPSAWRRRVWQVVARLDGAPRIPDCFVRRYAGT